MTPGHDRFGPEVARFDAWADDELERLRGNPVADAVFSMASHVGDFSVLWHIIAATRGVTSAQRRQQAIVLSGALAVESLVVNQGIKRLFARTRPTESGDERFVVRQPNTSSFPSGHASSAFFAASILTKWNGPKSAPLWFGLAAIVGTSRAYVRVHHASDVVAGAALGLTLGALANRFVRRVASVGMVTMPTFDTKMSDAEGLMWRMEKDPYLSSTFGNVTILDKKPDMDRLLRRMEHATWIVPRLRQRVQPSTANLTAPTWVDDTNFDVRYHVRHMALPKPGSVRQLLDLASLLVNDPFDRTRPLWQFVIVDGLRGGKSALVEKLHHTIADGEGSVQLSLAFLDFDRDAPEPPPLDPDSIETPTVEPPQPGQSDLLHGLLAGPLRLPLGMLRQWRDLLADPTQIPEAGNAAADTVRGVISQLSDVEQARSPLWTQRSLKRRIETVRAPYAETRAVATQLGGKLNTAFLTVAAEASSRYHITLGAPVEQLRASMAISTRSETSGANAFSLVRLLIPTGEMPIADRFAAIHEASAVARGGAGGASLSTLAAVAAALPTSLVTRLARQQAQTVDFATSNVRGAPIAMYLAGAQVLENYPIGPLGGVAFNLTLLSYLGSLDMGVNIDTAAVTEPQLLHDCLAGAFDDLLALRS